jgi:phenylacetate-coenzyme A ligase PaaK-like adenylate-forming protein
MFHPCLPIQFFKSQSIQTGQWQPEAVFTSSGTTGQQTSRHLVRSLDAYLNNAVSGFESFYGQAEDWVVLALLPSYLEREGSSLVAMAERLISLSKYQESGFFLHDFDTLKEILLACKRNQHKILLLGVSFALLDFAAHTPLDLSGITIMETGGMKGRRKELTREELHQQLKEAFGVSVVHSEYGMTELFSQAYATSGDMLFRPAKTMRVFATEINDPFGLAAHGKTGVLNVVDLANLDTCSFIQTEDLGRVHADGSFEILGRLDAAELRGCNLMVE